MPSFMGKRHSFVKRLVKYFKIIICLIIISLTIVGCIVFPPGFYTYPGGIIESDLELIVEGKTTREEMLLKFGEPTAVVNEGAILLYDWPVLMEPPIRCQYILLEFNPDGTLQRFKRGDHGCLRWSRIRFEKVLELIRKDIEGKSFSDESNIEE